jgi:hypothetical protein
LSEAKVREEGRIISRTRYNSNINQIQKPMYHIWNIGGRSSLYLKYYAAHRVPGERWIKALSFHCFPESCVSAAGKIRSFQNQDIRQGQALVWGKELPAPKSSYIGTPYCPRTPVWEVGMQKPD